MRSFSAAYLLRQAPLFAGIAISLVALCRPALGTVYDDVGYNALKAELGASMPTGAGVPVSQIEAPDGSGNYGPSTGSAEFAGKTFTPMNGATGTSNHAWNVADYFYGNTLSGNTFGVAPGVTNIKLWNANPWLDTSFLKSKLNPVPSSVPAVETQKVQNHSWIGAYNSARDNDALLRFDYMINRDKVVAVVGANNGSGSTMYPMFEQAYNSISVGRSDGGHSAGFTNIEGSGRIKPDIVVPMSLTSYATPFVSGTAAVLLDKASTAGMTDASNPEVIKSVIMAGATKSQFPSWARTTTRPLDMVYGAGQLNMQRSYHILAAGEQHASASSLVTSQGWDYNTTVNGSKYYFFDVPTGHALNELSVMLNWNRVVTDSEDSPSIFLPVGSLSNLNLKLFSASGFSLGAQLDASLSTVDNLEHTYFNGGNTTSLHAGRYAIEVSATDANVNYGLSWLSVDLLLGDMNGDGLLNNFDINPFELALSNPSSYLSSYPSMTKYIAMGDINGDGAFNNFDILPFEQLLTMGPAAGVPKPSSIVLLAAGILTLAGLRLRRFCRR